MSRAVKFVFVLALLAASVLAGFPSLGPEGLRLGPDPAEARFGRMRSFGFRGSRGMFRRRSFRPRRRSFGSQRSRFGSRRRGFGSSGRRSMFGGMGGFGGGLMGGMAGMLLGGMIGRMMFGGMGGFGGGMGGGGGIGLLEILLIGGGIFLFMRYLRNRQAPAYESHSSSHYGGRAGYDDDPYDVEDDDRRSGGVYRGSDIGGGYGRGSGPVAATYAADSRAEEGIPGITAGDSSFSRENFLIDARERFQRFQTAWVNRDLSPVRDLLDGDIFEQCQGDLDKLRSQGRANRLENIDIKSISLAESWQEDGFDFITVTYDVSLLDYVVSDSDGEVVEGSRTEPVRFTEHWTWARPSGSNPWILTAIGQA